MENKILGAIVAHDKKMDVLERVIKSALAVDGLASVELFVFDTEKLCAKLGNSMGLRVNTYQRPEIDMSKITCSYKNILTGMWEGELMHLSWLRNTVLDYMVANGYDYLYFIDADILMPKDSVTRLLRLDCDVALGWHFHKRLPVPAVDWVGLREKEIDQYIIEKRVVDGKNGTCGGILVKRSVCENARFEVYNGLQAEDGTFYRKVKEVGYTMKIDLGLNYPHIGDDYTPKALAFAKEKGKLWNVPTEYLK